MSWPFEPFPAPDDFDEAEFVSTIDQASRFLGALAHAGPTPAQVALLRADLRRWTTILDQCRVPDEQAPFGQIPGTVNHALGSLPDVRILAEEPGALDAEVRFSRWHLGGGGTVHGGQVAVALDELMGRTQLLSGWVARTAYLNVTYRAGTPFEEDLRVEVRTTRSEGRKQFLTSRILRGSTLCASADALFVRVAEYAGAPAPAAIACRPGTPR